MASGSDRNPIIIGGLPSQVPDFDPEETEEWLDSLDAAVDERGRERARYLMLQLIERAREKRVAVPEMRSTDYVNTIATKAEPYFPGNEEIERKVLNATSAGTPPSWSPGPTARHRRRRPHRHLRLLRVPLRGGLQPLLPGQGRTASRRRPGLLPGPRLARHVLPRLPRGPAQRGAARRLPPGEVAGPDGLSSYPHPRLMPDFWEFPTVSMGLGPIGAIYQARFNRYLTARGIKDTSDSHVWAFLGDGEMDEPESLGALITSRRARASTTSPWSSTATCSASTARCAATARSCRSWRARSAAPAGTSSSWSGAAVGRAAGAGRRRGPGQRADHRAGRPVPDLRDRDRRLHPRGLLRRRPAAARDGRGPDRRADRAPRPRRSRRHARSTRRTRRPRRTRASRP